MYTENYKTSLKLEIKEDLSGSLRCSWCRRLNVVAMAAPKLICRFSTVPIKTSAGPFAEVEKRILKFIWKCKE